MWFYEHEICISLLHCAHVNFVVFVSLSQPSVWYKNILIMLYDSLFPCRDEIVSKPPRDLA
jgi:hypothetical protein